MQKSDYKKLYKKYIRSRENLWRAIDDIFSYANSGHERFNDILKRLNNGARSEYRRARREFSAIERQCEKIYGKTEINSAYETYLYRDAYKNGTIGVKNMIN